MKRAGLRLFFVAKISCLAIPATTRKADDWFFDNHIQLATAQWSHCAKKPSNHHSTRKHLSSPTFDDDDGSSLA